MDLERKRSLTHDLTTEYLRKMKEIGNETIVINFNKPDMLFSFMSDMENENAMFAVYRSLVSIGDVDIAASVADSAKAAECKIVCDKAKDDVDEMLSNINLS